ncbi:MAG: L-glutamate gamma-semialdehyde dehydrogenase [Alphaproteobacteria bacterium]
MTNAFFKVPEPCNEPIKSYEKGSKEREDVIKSITELKNKQIEIPLIIGGKEVKTGNIRKITCPHNHSQVLGFYHQAGEKEIKEAITSNLRARKEWANMPWEDRAAIFLKAAELLSGSWRSKLNAATMLAQSKTIFQAEIDAACELADFWRFNSYYMTELMSEQPCSSKGVWNKVEYRPLEGFVFAVTPFNFTSIAGNLPTAPAMLGNVALWKPASSAVYSSYFVMKLLMAAGLPDGVINFVPGLGTEVGDIVMASPDLAGVHFTGSTAVFKNMWQAIASNLDKAKYYPRIVGETGGKDFIFAHSSADVDELVVASLRGAFEYQGQKCSAASRLYIPKSIWGSFKTKYVAEVGKIKMGDVEDFSNFMSAVIDKKSYASITEYIDYAKISQETEIITGGSYNDEVGYFVEPTTIVTTNPKFKTMVEEIFGPVLTIYVYDDDKFEETLKLCDESSIYGLTGAVFAKDRNIINKMSKALKDAAGNFYINDKPTGAVVGQQPFGGGRASGTNDKAGSKLNLLRWVNARTIKETFEPAKTWRYPFMD